MPSRAIHATTNSKISFFFKVKLYFIVWSHVKCFYYIKNKEKRGQEGRKEKENKETQKILIMMYIFITEIVVMTTEVYTYVQTHQTVYINDVQIFVYPIIPQKSWGKNKISITRHITYLNKG